jgi:hypothetical protein
LAAIIEKRSSLCQNVAASSDELRPHSSDELRNPNFERPEQRKAINFFPGGPIGRAMSKRL